MRFPRIFALALLFCSFLPVEAGGYENSPYVSIGALRLDVTEAPESQIPAGWRYGDLALSSPRPDPYRLVKFSGPVGSRQRELLAAAGYTVLAYHPFNSFLVRAAGEPSADLAALEGVSWTGPFHPYFKVGEMLAQALSRGDAGPLIAAEPEWGLRFNVRLHEEGQRPQAESAVQRAPGVLTVFPTRELPIRVQVDPERFAAFLQSIAFLPEVVVVEPWFPRKLHNDENAQISQSGVCVNNGTEAPNTTIFNHGITGWNTRLVVADSCTDSNEGWWYDDSLLRLPAHETDFPWTSSAPDWAQRKLVEYYDMWSADTTMGCAGASDHGTHVSGTMTGNCSVDAEGIATQTNAANGNGDQDGMAPGAKLIAQDLGGDALGYLNGDGGSLGELYNLAFSNSCLGADCGIDVHNNSWGADANVYDFDAFSGDNALWSSRRGVIVTSAGNAGSAYDTIGTPAVGKNVIAVGDAGNCTANVLSGGSSRGRTSDGRVKPDVVAGGSSVTSANNDGNGTTNANGGCSGDNTFSGTSMAAPTVTGLAGLVLQYFNDGFYPAGAASAFNSVEPSGPLMKATLINTSQRMVSATTAERNGVTWPNMDQGWGFVVLDNSLYFTGDARRLWVHDETVGVDVSGTSSMTFRRKVTSSAEPLKVTLVWYDTGHTGGCGGGTPCLDNDLDLTVVEETSGNTWTTTLVTGTSGHVVPRTVVPSGLAGIGQTTTNNGPDDLNTVEQVLIYNPAANQTFSFMVTAANTPDGPIPFALVATGALADPCSAPTGAPAVSAVDLSACANSGVQVNWSQDVAAWNDGGTGIRSYRVFRDGMPISSGGCAGTLGYATTSCIDNLGPDNFSADYRVEYRSGCGATVHTAEATATDGVGFVVDALPDEFDVCPGASVVLTANVNPAGSYTFQWTEDGLDMAGETASTLSVTKGAPESHSYNCRTTGACANVDQLPVAGSWVDDPPRIEFDPTSFPQGTLTKLCGDADTAVEPGEIWSLDVGVKNTSLCNTGSNVTAELALNAASSADAVVCNPQGEFGTLAPGAAASDGFAFEVSEGLTCPDTMIFDIANINWSGGGPTSDEAVFTVVAGGNCNVTTTCSCASIKLTEVSPTGSPAPLTLKRAAGSLVDLTFQKITGATSFNVYVSTQAQTQPFQVNSPSVGKKDCGMPWVSQLGGKALIQDYDVEAGIPAGADVYYILVTGDKGTATEGPLGFTSAGGARSADSSCN